MAQEVLQSILEEEKSAAEAIAAAQRDAVDIIKEAENAAPRSRKCLHRCGIAGTRTAVAVRHQRVRLHGLATLDRGGALEQFASGGGTSAAAANALAEQGDTASPETPAPSLAPVG